MFLDAFIGDPNRQVSDLKFKLVKSEQDITALEQNVSISSFCLLVCIVVSRLFKPASSCALNVLTI